MTSRAAYGFVGSMVLTREAQEARQRLIARYPRQARTDGAAGPQWGRDLIEDMAADVSDVISTGDRERSWQHPALSLRQDPTPPAAEDVLDALTVSAYIADHRLRVERELIEMARRRGLSWTDIARATGRADGRAAQRYHQWLLRQVGPPRPTAEQTADTTEAEASA
jgi:hypothetical protein